MDILKTHNTVVGIKFLNELNLKNISELLLCYYIEKSVKYYVNNSLKIPFFGMENIIISIRYDMKSRGLRIGGKQLRNTVAIDLQYCSKNLHIKISKHKMLITGCLNEKMGIDAFFIVLDKIKNVNDCLKKFNNLEEEIKELTIEWICKEIKKDETNIYMYDDNILIEKFNNFPKNCDYNFAKYLSMFSYDCNKYENFIKKIEIIKSISKNDDGNYCYNIFPKLYKYNIFNLIYLYNILENIKTKKLISLIKLTKFLLKNNYSTSYHNWHKKCINVFIPIDSSNSSTNTDEEDDEYEEYREYIESDDENDDIEYSDEDEEDEDSLSESENININKKYKKNKIKGHRFQIHHNGSIRQNSPIYKKIAYSEMLKFSEFLKKNINEFVY